MSDIIIRQSALRYLQIRLLLRGMPRVVSRQWDFEPARNPHGDRQRLATLDVDTEFWGLLSGALPHELPRLYLEDYHTAHAEWISGGTSGEHVLSTSVPCCVTRFRRPTDGKSPETAPANVIAHTMANIEGDDS